MKKVGLMLFVMWMAITSFLYIFNGEGNGYGTRSGSGYILEDGVYVESENEINPAIGTVFNIRALNQGQENTPEQDDLIAEYQNRILGFLIQQKIKHVFVESLDQDYLISENQHNSLKFPVREMFKAGAPKTLNLSQKDLLLNIGAVMAYALLNDDVVLHRTITPEESQRLDAEMSRLGPYNPEALTLFFDEKEKLAVRELNSFLQKNPGAKVALVFGHMHSFDKYFSNDDSPSLYFVSYEDLLDEYNELLFSGMKTKEEEIVSQLIEKLSEAGVKDFEK